MTINQHGFSLLISLVLTVVACNVYDIHYTAGGLAAGLVLGGFFNYKIYGVK